MALQNTGSISLGDVNVELGNSRTTTINMGGSAVRGLFDRSSGECKLALHGRGKANATSLTISSNTNNYDISAALVSAGGSLTDGVPVRVTINSGVTVGSTSTSTPAMKTNIGWSSGSTITIVNNGSIVGTSGSYGNGAGGNGGGGNSGSGGAGDSGTSGGGLPGGPCFEHSQTADNNLAVVFDTVGTRAGGAGGTGYGLGGGGGGGQGSGTCGPYSCYGGGAGGGGAGFGAGGSSFWGTATSGTATTGGGGFTNINSAGYGNGGNGGGKSGSGSAGADGDNASVWPGGAGGAGGVSQTSTGASGAILIGNTAQIS